MNTKPVLMEKRYDLARTKLQGNNSVKISAIKADLLESGIDSLFLGAAKTGMQLAYDADDNIIELGMLEPAEHIKVMKACLDYAGLGKHDAKIADDTSDKWLKLAAKMVLDPSETKETPHKAS